MNLWRATMSGTTVPPPMNTPTVSDTVHRYLRERAGRHEFSHDTLRTARSILHRFAAAAGPGLPIDRLTRRQVNRWWDGLEVGRSSARNQLSTVRTFARWCVEHDLLHTDPSRHLRAPKEPRRVPRTVPAPQATVLTDRLPDTRSRLVVMWMLHLGLRCGEVARLQVGDIDRDARLVVVRGKGGHERVLPIPAEAWHALTDYLTEHPATSGPLVRRYDDEHRGLSPHYVSDLVRRWMSDAGVKAGARDGMSGHALRRTCASDLLDGGANIRQVQAVLGHASIATTERYLRRSDAADLRAVMDGRHYHTGDA